MGDGVGQDYQQAVYWFRKAAEQGLTEAQEALQSLPSTPSTPPQSQPIPSAARKAPTQANIYGYISSMSKNALLQSITDEYYRIKGTFDMAPAMGIYGSFEFAGVLLIWKYLRENLHTNFREFAEFMIPLGAHIGCAYNCMPAGEWSDRLEALIKAHDLLPYDEFSQIYRYLKEYFSNEIHAMEFCGEAVIATERLYQYYAFVRVYNALPDFPSALNYFEEQGLRIKQDMPFRINSENKIDSKDIEDFHIQQLNKATETFEEELQSLPSTPSTPPQSQSIPSAAQKAPAQLPKTSESNIHMEKSRKMKTFTEAYEYLRDTSAENIAIRIAIFGAFFNMKLQKNIGHDFIIDIVAALYGPFDSDIVQCKEIMEMLDYIQYGFCENWAALLDEWVLTKTNDLGERLSYRDMCQVLLHGKGDEPALSYCYPLVKQIVRNPIPLHNRI